MRFVMVLRCALFLLLGCALPCAGLAQDIAPMALNSVGMVPPKIAGAPVKDTHGAIVGQVAKIETDQEGKPLRADITLNSGRMVFLDTAALSYDENANVLVTGLDQQQLAQLANQRSG